MENTLFFIFLYMIIPCFVMFLFSNAFDQKIKIRELKIPEIVLGVVLSIIPVINIIIFFIALIAYVFQKIDRNKDIKIDNTKIGKIFSTIWDKLFK